MLQMVDRQKIIHYYRFDGMGLRAISRELGYNRKTIKKVIAEYEAAANNSNAQESIDDVLTLRPQYNSANRTFRRLTPAMIDVIEDCLKRNEIKRATGLKKQCMMKCDIHSLLLHKGYKISYSTVCKYITDKEAKPNTEAFIRQSYAPGYGVEFDWGEVKLYIRGQLTRFYIAVFTFQYSNGRHAYLFRHQNTLAFLESHRNFFRDVKGVPVQMIYDNMRVAVKEFTGEEKKPTEALLRMTAFYGFSYRFCNIRAGWEKGHVERSVEFLRRKAYAVHDKFDDIEEAQKHLADYCSSSNQESGSLSTANKNNSYVADVESLKTLHGDIGCFERSEHIVDKWSTFTFNCSHYSVPDELVGNRVSIKIHSEKIVVFYNQKKVAAHERSYSPGSWKIDINHYLKTMQRKPGSIGGSEALKQAPEAIRTLFNKCFSTDPKEFVSLLLYAQDHGFTVGDISDTYKNLTKTISRNISAEQLKASLHNGNDCSSMEDVYTVDDVQHEEIEANAVNTLNVLTGLITSTFTVPIG